MKIMKLGLSTFIPLGLGGRRRGGSGTLDIVGLLPRRNVEVTVSSDAS